MIHLYRPENEIELSFIKSIFESEKIPYYVQNDHFGSLYIGPQIALYNSKMIMVQEDYYDRAHDLISDFLKNQADEENQEPEIARLTWFDKIRVIVETMIFMWFVPGKVRKKDTVSHDE